MGLVVNTNMMSINLLNDMNKNIKKTQKSQEKLASGFKINRAGDDASGLAVSEKMRNKIAALDTQIDTDEDDVNLIQTADGYMAEVQSMVERMVELTMKSTNGVLSNHPDRDNLQKEMNQLCGEIDRIATTANFNGIKLLSGAGTEKIKTTKIIDTVQNIPYSNLLNDVRNFTGSLIDDMDIYQTIEYLSDIANNYVKNNNGNKQCLNDMAVYYSSSGSPSIVASKNADIGDLKEMLGMDDGETLNKIETSRFGDVESYDVQIPEISFVMNDDDGSKTAALIGGALNSYKAGFSDLNCMKGVSVYYTDDGNYAFVGPNNSNSIDIQNQFNDMGATVPVACKSLPVYTDEKKPSYYTIPAQTPVTVYIDKKLNLNLKIGESSTAADKIELELFDFHSDHLFEPEFEEKVVGTRTEVQTVTYSGNKPHASVFGNSNSQSENHRSGTSGGSYQRIVTIQDVQRVQVNPLLEGNEASTYMKAVVPDISTQDNAIKNIDAIKKASGKISSMRGDYGAKQNRIEHTINVITTESENTKAAKSRIQDTDMAVQISQYTSQNIMTQAAQSLFAQANAKPQEVNSLLQAQG